MHFLCWAMKCNPRTLYAQRGWSPSITRGSISCVYQASDTPVERVLRPLVWTLLPMAARLCPQSVWWPHCHCLQSWPTSAPRAALAGHCSVLGWQRGHPEACVISISEDSQLQCLPRGLAPLVELNGSLGIRIKQRRSYWNNSYQGKWYLFGKFKLWIVLFMENISHLF